QRERGRLDSAELDLARNHGRLGPRMAAVRTAVVPQVADVDSGVVVRRAAADAVLRVGRVLEGRPGPPRVVEPEDRRAGAGAREARSVDATPEMRFAPDPLNASRS